MPLRAPGQVQPPPPDRDGARRQGRVRGRCGFPGRLDGAMIGGAARAAAYARERWPRILLAAGLLAVLFGNAGFRSLVGNWIELRRLRAEFVGLEAEEGELDAKLKSLRAGDGGIERLARKELGYIKKGEIEYRFPPPEKK
ncbi:MAG TPA: hypothetical protein DCZ01_11065 [Elusimicrobia bacterium]|nr:hypothetical protein [Elusimicrobiota bacterium]